MIRRWNPETLAAPIGTYSHLAHACRVRIRAGLRTGRAGCWRLRERGLLIGRGGLLGNVLRVTPPMTVTAAEADEALAVLREVLAEVSIVEQKENA
ncbi:hypothetical protein [Amycolatopsis sp. WGS_07]|uniref:hypothetical protein n=1 Tax=Amycolatopsis sp. WGS_07 TaxID=3076764 RepID=UPI0038739DEF